MNPVALLAGLLPVLLFLAGLMLMDSYKLVARPAVLRAIGAGAIAAGLAFTINVSLLGPGHVSPFVLQRYLAPVIEESLKALYVIVLIRLDRVGFMVDAGIQGFTVGAGFALVENLYYAHALADPDPVLWLVRGLGTAVMHGGATAIVGIVTKNLADHSETHGLAGALPGLAIAIAVHAAYNALSASPLVGVALLFVTMPLLLFLVFERSERATQNWLGVGLDADVELLELIHSGAISDTRVGHYLESLKSRFPGPVVGDMLCLLQIRLELALRAKGMLLARQAGLDVPIDRDVAANFAEMTYLQKAIGPTGWIAILPFIRASRRDLWQIEMMMKR